MAVDLRRAYRMLKSDIKRGGMPSYSKRSGVLATRRHVKPGQHRGRKVNLTKRQSRALVVVPKRGLATKTHRSRNRPNLRNSRGQRTGIGYGRFAFAKAIAAARADRLAKGKRGKSAAGSRSSNKGSSTSNT